VKARRAAFRFYLITDRELAALHGGLPEVVEAALGTAAEMGHAGAIAVQLREKDLPASELYKLAGVLLAICRRHHAPLLINDRLDVTIAVGADGVHLPSSGVPAAAARAMLGPSALIGVSTHQMEEIGAAARGGADFVVFGPVFDPLSKPAYGAAGGGESLAAACRTAAIPVYALGGITAERIHGLNWTGAFSEGARPAGVGVIGAVFGANHPRAATRELLEALETWR
jgi:thiamine-phosphate pyrophosphorylase